MPGDKRMVVFAGPNGSGKSTVTGALMDEPGFPANYINADEIQKTIDPTEYPHLSQRELQAANMAKEQRQAALNGDASFAFETVMSTPVHLATFDQAREKGFKVDMVFVTTEDSRINLQRVDNRVQQGGHGVAPEKIVERYDRAMNMLPVALEKADTARVYDNSHMIRKVNEHGQVSLEPAPPFLVAEKKDGKIVFPAIEKPDWMPQRDFDDMRAWVDKTIREPVQAREHSLEAIGEAQRRVNPDASVSTADIQDGRTTSGRIVGIDGVHVLQHSRADGNFVAHDRALLSPGMLPALEKARDEGRDVSVAYQYDGGGKIKDQTQTLHAQQPGQAPGMDQPPDHQLPRAKL